MEHRSVPDDKSMVLGMAQIMTNQQEIQSNYCLIIGLWPQAQGQLPLRKELQEALFQEAGTGCSQDAGKASLLRGRRGSHPACVCKPLFGRNRLVIQWETSRSAERTEVSESGLCTSPSLCHPCKAIPS